MRFFFCLVVLSRLVEVEVSLSLSGFRVFGDALVAQVVFAVVCSGNLLRSFCSNPWVRGWFGADLGSVSVWFRIRAGELGFVEALASDILIFVIL